MSSSSDRRNEAKLTTQSGAQRAEIFDGNADLTLVVDSHWYYKVRASSLAQASPVFRTMLFGGFSESKPAEGEWVVKLPEDDRSAMEIFLNIMHGHVYKVPEKLSHMGLILPIVKTADKYDLTHLLKPWAEAWLREYARKRDKTWLIELIWAAWVLGDTNLLNHQLDRIFRNLCIGEDHAGQDIWIIGWDLVHEDIWLSDIDSGICQENTILKTFDISGKYDNKW
jgi:hypothetical protein